MSMRKEVEERLNMQFHFLAENKGDTTFAEFKEHVLHENDEVFNVVRETGATVSDEEMKDFRDMQTDMLFDLQDAFE